MGRTCAPLPPFFVLDAESSSYETQPILTPYRHFCDRKNEIEKSH